MEVDNATPTLRTRPTNFRLCAGASKTGEPCKMAALRGEDLCRHHSRKAQREREDTQASSIPVAPLSSLVSMDVTDDALLKRFRRGLLAHVGRGTLGVQEARAMHELAQSIHDAAHKDDQTKGFTDLASSIAKELGS